MKTGAAAFSRVLGLGLVASWSLMACSGRLSLDPSAYQSPVLVHEDGGGPASVDAFSLPPAGGAGGGGGGRSGNETGTDASVDRAASAPVDAAALPTAGGKDGAVDLPSVADAAWPAADSAPAAPVSACAVGVDGVALLATKCGGCHGAHSPAKGLDLVSSGLANRLFGVTSGCMGRPLLDPSASPVSGVLLDRMAGTSAGCGPQMPYGAAPLSDADQACIAEWSQQAADKR